MSIVAAFPVAPIIFWFFASIVIISGLMVIIARQPVHGVLFLVLAFFSSAVLWMLLKAEFLALLLIFVYVGAVMTLFLFVVMLLNFQKTSPGKFCIYPLAIACGVIVFFVGALSIALRQAAETLGLTSVGGLKNTYTLQALAQSLYTEHVYAFEGIGFLLLVAIVTVIAIVHRRTGEVTEAKITSEVSEQMKATKANRLRLISLPSESTKKK